MFQYQWGSAVNDYYLEKIREVSESNKLKIRSLKTKEDAIKYIEEVKSNVCKSFALPKEKCPLNAKVTKKVEAENYIVESVIYESRESFPVTANLYLPINAKNAPAVLFLCGHAKEGKHSETYSTCAANLAENGYVVLIVDPISQGERYQLNGVEGNEKITLCGEHNLLGKQMILVGENFGSWRVFDALRGIDYLLTRKEVNPDEILVTGNSGGGTLTTFVGALSDKVKAIAPSCYITSWRRNVENELPVDVEQIPPFLGSCGCEMVDLLVANAPRPVLILGQEQDMFDIRGTKESYDELKHIYKLLGKEDDCQYFAGPTVHGYSIHNRESMYNFFNSLLGKAPCKENPNIKLFSEKEICCTDNGQVSDLAEMKLVQDFIKEKAEKLSKNRILNKEELKKWLDDSLKISKYIEKPYYRILRPEIFENLNILSRFAIESEQNKVLSVLKYFDKSRSVQYLPAGEHARLYIAHLDSRTEVLQQLNGDENIFSLDVRGIGECTPAGTNQEIFGKERDFFEPYQFDYHYASLGLLLDDSYLGGKVRDVLSSISLLSNNFKSITLEGRNQSCIVALLAALYSPVPVEVKLFDYQESFFDAATSRISYMPQSAMIRNILSVTDMPELIKLTGAKIIS